MAGAGAALMSNPGFWSAIAAGVSALSQMLGGGGDSGHDTRKFVKEMSDKAVKQFRFKKLKKGFEFFNDFARKEIAQGLGSQYQAGISAMIGDMGFRGSGTGIALQQAAAGMPSVMAYSRAMDLTMQRAQARANARMAAIGGSPGAAPQTNQLADTVAAGTRAFSTVYSALNPNGMTGGGNTTGSNSVDMPLLSPSPIGPPA